jgi:hypothetical protein
MTSCPAGRLGLRPPRTTLRHGTDSPVALTRVPLVTLVPRVTLVPAVTRVTRVPSRLSGVCS